MIKQGIRQEEEQFERAVGSMLSLGYAIIDDFLSAKEAREALCALQANFRAGQFGRAGIGNKHSYQMNQAIRRDRIQWLDHRQPMPACQPFFQRLQALVDYFNRTCYLGVRDLEMHFALYPPGGFYKRHLDVFHRSQSRKLSAICYLNFDWREEDGGALLMYLPQKGGSEEVVKVLPNAGKLVLFNSQTMEHEVQVAQRERCSITGWLKDEAALF